MSSSFKYTLTKLRTLPSSLKICLRKAGNCAVSAFSASPTVAPGTATASCLPVNCRRGVGIRTLGISVTQLLFLCRGLFDVWQPTVGVMKLAVADGKHHERVPRA